MTWNMKMRRSGLSRNTLTYGELDKEEPMRE